MTSFFSSVVGLFRDLHCFFLAFLAVKNCLCVVTSSFAGDFTTVPITVGLLLFSVSVNKAEAELIWCSAEMSSGSSAQSFMFSNNAEIF